MNIGFELFGSFYNTNVNYCGLFSDIENNSCDFNTFKLRKDMTILINPPFTEIWIKKSCKIIENIMKKNLNTIIYNGIIKKKINLKDNVHLFKFNSNL